MERVYANITNGLAFHHDDVCNFLSMFGHDRKLGYFRMDSMPYSAVIRLLQGKPIRVVDATQHGKAMTDAQRFGLTTWAMVFNRALRQWVIPAPWVTREMISAACERRHRPLVKRIRRLEEVYGNCGPVRIGEDELIRITCHRLFTMDDKPHLLKGTKWASGSITLL